jgi:hypothetical protein
MMTPVLDEQLVVAGWVLVVPTPTPHALGKSLPSTIITTSQCIMEDLPRPEFWDWYQDLAEAERDCEVASQARVITVAMHPDDATAFMTAHSGEPAPHFEMLRRHQPLSSSARVLGYEVVGAQGLMELHSWHCHGYADDVAKSLGILVNDDGLLSTRDQALAVLRWMSALPADQTPASADWTVIALADRSASWDV